MSDRKHRRAVCRSGGFVLSNISEKAIGRTYDVVCAPIPVATVTHDDMSFQVVDNQGHDR
jgi:hypothetical protein